MLGAAGSAHRELLRAGARYAFWAPDRADATGASTPPVRARRVADGAWALTGRARFATHGANGGTHLVPALVTDAGRPRVLLAAVPGCAPGSRLTVHRTISGEPLGVLELAGVLVAPGHVLAGGDDADERGARALDAAVTLGRLALAAQVAGGAAGLLRACVERVGGRLAYGAPLAALQTVRHRAADAYLDVLAARDAVRAAAAALAAADLGAPDPRTSATVAAAKATATEAALRVAASAHQLCGGWGHLDDAGLHLFTRAIKAAEGQLGAPVAQRTLVAGFLREQEPPP
jgi:alkylation response protein AidB-like acyl-CoA dehydrogenase